MFANHGVEISTWGLSALPGFTILGKKNMEYKTFITQEMLKHSYLASNTVYVCTEHTQDILDDYFEKLDSIVELIGECEKDRDIYDLLDGPVCNSGFKRLN